MLFDIYGNHKNSCKPNKIYQSSIHVGILLIYELFLITSESEYVLEISPRQSNTPINLIYLFNA